MKHLKFLYIPLFLLCGVAYAQTPTFTATPCCQGLTAITGLNRPTGMAIDYARNVLYLADSSNSLVRTYNSLTFVPGPVISAGLSTPYDVALDTDGNVYVAEFNNEYIEKYGPAPANTPITVIGAAVGKNPRGIWVDGSGASATIYATYDGGGSFNGIVDRFGGGGVSYTLLAPAYGVSQLSAPTGMVKVGNLLYVADSLNGRVVAFDATQPNPTPTPVASTTGLGTCTAVRTDLAGNFYVVMSGGGEDQFDPGFNNPRACTLPINTWGVAVNQSGNVMVSEINGTTVTILQGCETEPTLTPTSSYMGSNPPAPGQCFIFPSPVRGSQAAVSYDMAEPGTMDLKIWNDAGELAAEITDHKPTGVQVTNFDPTRLAPRIYFYIVTFSYDSGKVEKTKPAKFAVIR